MFQSHRTPFIALSAFVILSTSLHAAPIRFDFQAAGGVTQAGWTAADLGSGSDGTVSVATEIIGGVTLDTRDRAGGNFDAGGGAEAAMWNDFVFAGGAFDTVPGSGLQITITGLTPDTPYPVTIWAFDDASNPSPAGVNRNADWSGNGGDAQPLSFPDAPDPASLDDYHLALVITSDETGSIVLRGIVSTTNPSTSHNVFVNGLEIGDPLLDSDGDDLADSFERDIIDADEDDLINTLADVLPGDDFDNDGSNNLEESERVTDPVDDDSDDDGFLDGAEDGGGAWVNADETGTNPLAPDTDGDGLLDGVENHDLAYDPDNPTTQPGSDPNEVDTDGDGVRDGTEVLADGTDPTDADDFIDPLSEAVAKFDFNAADSPTQTGWTAADLGNGTDGTVTVSTEAIGGVTLDTRDRPAANTDGVGSDIDNNDLWRDFVFANGSFDSAPGSGLRITLTGLRASTTYPITIWGFDESSNNNRMADWGPAGEPLQTLTFPTEPDPASLDDYLITFEVSTDATGQAVIEGLVAAVTPSTSHNVFVNFLAVGEPTGSTQIRITEIAFDRDANVVTLTWTSKPGASYAVRASGNLDDDAVGSDPRLWPDLDDGVASGGETTSFMDESPPAGQRFYVVEEL